MRMEREVDYSILLEPRRARNSVQSAQARARRGPQAALLQLSARSSARRRRRDERASGEPQARRRRAETCMVLTRGGMAGRRALLGNWLTVFKQELQVFTPFVSQKDFPTVYGYGKL